MEHEREMKKDKTGKKGENKRGVCNEAEYLASNYSGIGDKMTRGENTSLEALHTNGRLHLSTKARCN